MVFGHGFDSRQVHFMHPGDISFWVQNSDTLGTPPCTAYKMQIFGRLFTGAVDSNFLSVITGVFAEDC